MREFRVDGQRLPEEVDEHADQHGKVEHLRDGGEPAALVGVLTFGCFRVGRFVLRRCGGSLLPGPDGAGRDTKRQHEQQGCQRAGHDCCEPRVRSHE